MKTKAVQVAMALRILFGGRIATATDRPHILFILSDDHAQEAIGAYGSWLKDFVQTPTIDKLAAEGMRFTNHFPVNHPVCNVSRISFLSDRYPEVTGVLNCSNLPNYEL